MIGGLSARHEAHPSIGILFAPNLPTPNASLNLGQRERSAAVAGRAERQAAFARTAARITRPPVS
ncbi:hypothetical protein CKO25_02610 [Thiocapsa imhoffii]|uniref:Uncharacterized protein n=1 Tax=Thiocapsa imhoffii TaxID=382777 RepID=A0A9X1B846_9GAMM|nr:hypothetical protein [Thiocapsa imhoffii]